MSPNYIKPKKFHPVYKKLVSDTIMISLGFIVRTIAYELVYQHDFIQPKISPDSVHMFIFKLENFFFNGKRETLH